MQKRSLILALVLISLVTAASAGAQQAEKPLTNQDVISMVKSLLPENVIVAAIKTNDTNFDVTAGGLIALKRAGVSAKIMEAVLAAVNSKKTGASMAAALSPATGAAQAPVPSAFTSESTGVAPGAAATTAPPWQPVVSALVGKARVNVPAEATQIVLSKAKAPSLSALASDKTLDDALQVGTQVAQQAVVKSGSAMALSAFNPGAAMLTGILNRRAKQAKVTYVWALAGGSAPAGSGNPQAFDVNYSGLPGVNADQFEPVIVKLSPTPQANFRLVGATEAATNAEESTQQDWPVYSSFMEDRIAAPVQKFGYGHAQVTLAAPLSPGEYAVALRPVDKSKKFAGEDVGRNRGEGLLFNYAWPFSVK